MMTILHLSNANPCANQSLALQRLPDHALDTNLHSLQANKLIHHILLAYIPSFRYLGITAHGAKVFSLCPTHALEWLEQVRNVRHATVCKRMNI
jgi:hypothetical protein